MYLLENNSYAGERAFTSSNKILSTNISLQYQESTIEDKHFIKCLRLHE